MIFQHVQLFGFTVYSIYLEIFNEIVGVNHLWSDGQVYHIIDYSTMFLYSNEIVDAIKVFNRKYRIPKTLKYLIGIIWLG